MPDEIRHNLTPDERQQLAELFRRATGVELRMPPIDTPAAWLSEFHAAVAPQIRAMEATATQRR